MSVAVRTHNLKDEHPQSRPARNRQQATTPNLCIHLGKLPSFSITAAFLARAPTRLHIKAHHDLHLRSTHSPLTP